MPDEIPNGYWWECEVHHKWRFLPAVRMGIFDYIWNQLYKSNWNQSLLTIPCVEPNCRSTMRISYHFPGGENLTVRVVRIVGLPSHTEGEGAYVPMMWETVPGDHLFPLIRA